MLPTATARETFRFGDFDLDVSAYELRFKGRSIQIERRPMDLLVLLVERRGQLVSRKDIVERLWGQDVFVEVEPGINTVVWKIRGRWAIRRTIQSSSKQCRVEDIASSRRSRSWLTRLPSRRLRP